MKKFFQYTASDIPSSIVVFLVALPLCLGIALGSGAPLFSGIIAGIAGGMVVGMISGSSLSVSGPAAGLTAVVATAIGKMPVYEAFLLSVMIAGALQVIFGILRAGVVGNYVPNSVIRGMLAGIGAILILKQLPNLMGYTQDFFGDQAFVQGNSRNTFSELIQSLHHLSPPALIIGVLSVILLLLWDRPLLKPIKRYIPGPLAVVAIALAMGECLKAYGFPLLPEQLVNLPVASDWASFTGFFVFPKWEYLNNMHVWITGVTIALIASLETLLGIEAVDKLDPAKRKTPSNRELKAQGIGNMVSGLLGGLPVTSVIVRSSANVNAGAKSKLSTIMHGLLILLSVFFIPGTLNKIPLCALAAILVVTGYKLVSPSLFRHFYGKGPDQFIPFVVTIVAILLSDLLTGILIGTAVAMFSLLRSNFKSSVLGVNDENKYLVRFRKDISFLNKPFLKEKLESVPQGAYVLIDMMRADFIDKDIIDVVNEFILHAHSNNIRVEIKKSRNKSLHHLVMNHPIMLK
jgi:MFS superfamily sulfate permease-like transporter